MKISIESKGHLKGVCEDSLKKSEQKDTLIVTHGGVINIIYHILKGKKWSNQNKVFPIANTSMNQK